MPVETAMSLGRSEEIVRGDAGILVAPGNAAELAQAIAATLRNLKNGKGPSREFPEQFTPRFMCDAYLRVYEELRTRSAGAGEFA
jgi:glycosyltransferase involved in cell wall biosynthesis